MVCNLIVPDLDALIEFMKTRRLSKSCAAAFAHKVRELFARLSCSTPYEDHPVRWEIVGPRSNCNP